MMVHINYNILLLNLRNAKSVDNATMVITGNFCLLIFCAFYIQKYLCAHVALKIEMIRRRNAVLENVVQLLKIPLRFPVGNLHKTIPLYVNNRRVNLDAIVVCLKAVRIISTN